MATITQISKYYEQGIEYGTLKVSVPNADLLILGATPITILAAPGAGKQIIVDTPPITDFTYGSVEITVSVNVEITLADSSASGSLWYLPLSGTSSFRKPMILDSVQENYVANKALTIEMPDGNPTGGTGSSVIFYVDYKVITL